ncbi:HdeD family acid-resistance protein [Dyella telluris]|uniref:HdeD family acid-resistance protein n=1 Tax=Dyella telluris TaxID=2763498 RepID=A0A7G8Q8K8_9GAMM|nr:HdeD family acid-resistance protein [Dyella telluris]QNK03116.1 HdeD family acid-resistance protein [Dyella telluris]
MSSLLQRGVSRTGWLLVIYGVISILFGISAILWPGSTVVALTWAFGIMALAEGVISLFALFNRHVAVSRGWLVLYALASIVFGLLALWHPLAVVNVLLIFLAAWLIVAGVYRIVFAFRVRKEIQGEWMIALSGVLAIVLGGLLVAYPVAGLLTVAIWIGVAALVYGILQVIAGVRMHRFKRAL